MARLKPNLLIVAHPDDETIFFGGLVLAERRHPWWLICVTDGNGDGRGKQRHQELLAAARALKIKQVEQWSFADRYDQRLNVQDLIERLSPLSSKVHEIYTHGILGEYGHPHHQDVSAAVHQTFLPSKKVWSPAYNGFPQKRVALTAKQFQTKAKILSQTYRLETERFTHLLPVTAQEGFWRLDLKEIKALYATLREGQPLRREHMKHYAWLAGVLPQTAYGGLKRPF